MEAYEEFLQRVQDIHRLSALQGHLGWDQEVLMPSKGSSSRGEMMAWLAGKRHEQLTDARMGQLLTSLEKESLDPDQAANVREDWYAALHGTARHCSGPAERAPRAASA